MGVFPFLPQLDFALQRLPHARGGVSGGKFAKKRTVASSPRSWGCFCAGLIKATRPDVFPTLVGVFLAISRRAKRLLGLPHARGGVSDCYCDCYQCSESSPRSWGCFRKVLGEMQTIFVFPTLVGVFLLRSTLLGGLFGLPHARGGVSNDSEALVTLQRSSPRSWGCFSIVYTSLQLSKVFPTLVGVFLKGRCFRSEAFRLPHARGGVSLQPCFPGPGGMSSPRSWGCFPAHHHASWRDKVFPTLVGVFPDRRLYQR